MQTWIAFIKAHERLLALAGILALLYVLIGRVETAWDNHLARADANAVALAKANLAKQQAANAQLVQQNAIVQTQIADIEKQLAATRQQAAQVPAQVAAIPSSSLQSDIETKEGGPILSTPVLRNIDVAITELPVMQQELAQINADIAAKDKLNSNLVVQIANLNTQLTDQQNVCKAEIKQAVDVQKAKDRKHLRLMEKIAAIGGAILGGFIGHGI